MRSYDDYVGCNQDDPDWDDEETDFPDDWDDEPDIDESQEWADLPYGYDDEPIDERDCQSDYDFDF